MRLTLRLMKVLGGRPFLTFTVVTFLVGSLLAAVELTSRHALKLFVEDQLRRTPWDIAVYQTGGVTLENEVPNRMRSVKSIQQVESIAFLRASFPSNSEVNSEVDGKPLATPWICIMAASNPSLLPPKFQSALKALNQPVNGGESSDNGGILSLVGPDRAIGRAFLALQGSRQFSMYLNVGQRRRDLFTISLRGVIREERDELNRWFMDQIGSVTLIPGVSAVLLTPYQSTTMSRFDSVAMGIIPTEMLAPSEALASHVQQAEYEPEMIYVGRIQRPEIISGWDIPASLTRMQELRDRLQQQLESVGSTHLTVDSTTLVLLERMNRIARLIVVVSLLIALPLLWMAWVLAANLSGLLLFNERRRLGLMRLRGIPGQRIGVALVWTIVLGGLVGGVLGLALGSVIPLLIYEQGHLPMEVLFAPQHLILLLLFLVITLVLALEVSRRFVRYAATISPLEASGRFATSDAAQGRVRFSRLPLLCLLLGGYKLAGWSFGFALSAEWRWPFLEYADRALDFVALPLFLYGFVALLVSRRIWVQRLLNPLVGPIGGRFGRLALRQMAAKPHRIQAFLLIVALMASVSLYPTIAARSFEDKAVRGARVQVGAEWQFIFNSPDLVEANQLEGGLGAQYRALLPATERVVGAFQKVPGVLSASSLIEAILPNFYFPGYGIRGVPLYLVVKPDHYLENVYSEPELGITDSFRNLVAATRKGDLAVSPPVQDFWQIPHGRSLILGRDDQQKALSAPVGGVLAFLPGMPPRTVTDRQGFVQSRIDYLNFLFSNNAYIVASSDAPQLAGMQALIPRVIVLVKLDGNVPLEEAGQALLHASPVPPLEAHNLGQEIQKAGSDMFIFLALENMRIYLAGGLLLAVIGILAIAMTNYTEERHTLALLRIRGTPPGMIWRILLAMLTAPALLGVILGGLVALIAGYGLANYLWKLREIETVVGYLPTHLVVSALTLEITLWIIALLVAVASLFSLWVYRSTAHESVQET